MDSIRRSALLQTLPAALAGVAALAAAVPAQAAGLPRVQQLSSGLGTLLRWLLQFWF